MLGLYFGGITEILAFGSIVVMLCYIIRTYIKRNQIEGWGKKVLFVALFGLWICIIVAIRDHYGPTKEALFGFDSLQSTLCCIGGAIIAFGSISSIFIKKQSWRKAMFFLLSIAFVYKVLVIEISRIMLL